MPLTRGATKIQKEEKRRANTKKKKNVDNQVFGATVMHFAYPSHWSITAYIACMEGRHDFLSQNLLHDSKHSYWRLVSKINSQGETFFYTYWAIGIHKNSSHRHSLYITKLVAH